MFKEKVLSDEENMRLKKRVEFKTELVRKSLTEDLSDAEYIGKLHDLCVLNKMNESHNK